MSVTAFIPSSLEQQIAGHAAKLDKAFEQVALEMLEIGLELMEDKITKESLAQPLSGQARPIREVLEELRHEFGLPETWDAIAEETGSH